jgi:integrase
LDSLKLDNHVLDWQHRQASDSIRLYYFHYLNKTDARSVKALTSDSASEIIQETKHLIRLKHYSFSTERTYLQWIERYQAFNAILFFFRYVLGKEVGNLADTVRAKHGQKLPVVFSVEEVKRLLACMNGKNLLIAGLLYGAGLRLVELARLRVKDIDMDLNTLTVRSGKG